MVRSNQPDNSVTIFLRLPAPWSSPGELADALVAAESDFRFDDAQENAPPKLVHQHSGWSCECLASPHDDEIVELFAQGERRLSYKELKEIDSHAAKVHLVGPGGSIDTARAMMDAATAILDAGAFGVFVDNSGVTHGKRDWLKLAGDKQPGGLYWAYVMTTADRETRTVFSTGMHCLGLRDAELPDAPGEEEGFFLLHNFLGFTYQSGVELKDGDHCGDERTAMLRVRHRPCTRVPAGSPFHNPYGVWRLEILDENEMESEKG